LAVEDAGMLAEVETWSEALKNVSFYHDDSSLFVQISSAKVILFGFLERTTGDTPTVVLFSLSMSEERPRVCGRLPSKPTDLASAAGTRQAQ
jgi:hypothetical protein